MASSEGTKWPGVWAAMDASERLSRPLEPLSQPPGPGAAGSDTSDVGRAPRVTLIGPVNVDLFLRGEAPLDPAALQAWVGPSDVDLVVAGSIGYTAQVLARLGDRVELHTSVGDDAFGGFIRDALEAAGIEGRFIVADRGPTAIAIYVLLFGGHKRPMTYRLPGFEPWPDPLPVVRPGEPAPDLVHSGGLLHFPGMWHRGLAAAYAAGRSVGAMTAMDPQFPLVDMPAPWLPHVADALTEVDVLLCDEGELTMLFEAADTAAGIRAAHAAGPRVVAVKRAQRGSLLSDGGSIMAQPAVPLPEEQVREAVGAGDAFDGGLLDTLLRGGSLVEAARFGTAAAALTLTGRGGAEAIAARDAVTLMLERVPPARRWTAD